MKSLGSIFPVLAFVLALLFVTGAGPAGALEPSKKLQQLQDEAIRLHQAGSLQQALALAKQALAQAVEEFGPDSDQASMQALGAGNIADAAGDFAEAARQYTESLRVREIADGRDNLKAAFSPSVTVTLPRSHPVLRQKTPPVAASSPVQSN